MQKSKDRIDLLERELEAVRAKRDGVSAASP